MDFLTKGYHVLKGEKGQKQTAQETIDRLCDRVEYGTLLEDRRAAVMGLKGLSKEYGLEIGTKGMPILIRVLEIDRRDVEMTRACLETLMNVCGDKRKEGKDDTASTVTNNLGGMLSEMFVKEGKNVFLLLELLEEHDFHVRYQTVQFLQVLLSYKIKELQDCILTNPMGISRLIDLLDDSREIIRNEGLLLLIALTRFNADIQKIVAFENAFERLMDITEQEGQSDGGIIVQDCLHLMNNLLRMNVSNQNYFRETNCLQRLAKFFHHPPNSSSDTNWSKQKISNMTAMLELVDILVERNAANTSSNQNFLRQHRVLQAILDLSFAMEIPSLVRAKTLMVIGNLVRGNSSNQELMGGAAMIAQLVIMATASESDIQLRCGATYAVECYLLKNPAAQLGLLEIDECVTTILNVMADWETDRKNPFPCWFACVIFSHLIKGNPACKDRALTFALGEEQSEGDNGLALLPAIAHYLVFSSQEKADVRIQLGFFSVLCIWLHEHPASVSAFLSESVNLQYLIEQINQSSGIDPLLQGLAAFLLTLCVEYNNEIDSVLSRHAILNIITSRIGIDHFLNRITQLKSSDAFKNVSPTFEFNGIDQLGYPLIYFDFDIAEFIRVVSEKFPRVLTGVSEENAMEHQRNAQVESLQKIIREQEDYICQLKRKLKIQEFSSIDSGSPKIPSSPNPFRPDLMLQGVQNVEVENGGELALYKTQLQKVEDMYKELEYYVQTLTHENDKLKSQIDERTEYSREDVDNLVDEVERLRKTIADLIEDNESLRYKNEVPQANSITIELVEEKLHNLTTALEDQKQRFIELEKEQEDLLVCLAEQDMVMSSLKDRLRRHGETIESDEDLKLDEYVDEIDRVEYGLDYTMTKTEIDLV